MCFTTDLEQRDWRMASQEIVRLRAENAAIREALCYYANKKHWRKDDWGCLSIIQGADYGEGGKTARTALVAFPQTQDMVE
jgi:hypothetical protein